MTMSRKDFLRTLAGVGAGAIGATLLIGCGSDDDGGMEPGDDPNCVSNGTTATIGSNHGHSINVTMADISAGVEKTYDISGSSHAHMVTITAAQFAMLAANTQVSVTSTTGTGHTHSVTIVCV